MNRFFMLLHPFLLSMYPITFLYSQNIHHDLSEQGILLALMANLLFLGILLGLCLFFLRSMEKAALLSSAIIVFFFSYGPFFDFFVDMKSMIFFDLFSGMNRFLFPLWILAMIAFCRFLLQIGEARSHFTTFFNVISVTLNLLALFPVFFSFSSPSTMMSPSFVQKIPFSPKAGASAQASSPPDIYYIILDGYGSNKVLSEMYGFSNSSFSSFLEDRGFFIASESNSNYSTTAKSLVSSLNMGYFLPNLDIPRTRNSDLALIRLIGHSQARKFLELQGYSFHYFGTYDDWGMENQLSLHPLSEKFLLAIVEMTMLRPFLDIAKRSNEGIRNNVLLLFEELPRLPVEQKPRFVFSHIISPHPPYVFGPNGERVGEVHSTLSKGWEYPQNYLDQLVFLNSKVQELVDDILRNSKTTPIIILQGDHGPFSRFYQSHPEPHWAGEIKQLSGDIFRERMGILNAILVPPEMRGKLYSKISPINIFRFLFNNIFGQTLPMLEDRSFFSLPSAPFNLMDVTGKVITS